MSNPLAISGVTAVLQYCLTQVFGTASLPGPVTITAQAPDIVQANLGTGSHLQVNLFMHQVTNNGAWRNAGMPTLGPDGATRFTNPPLALDLHYLLTAYASGDTEG